MSVKSRRQQIEEMLADAPDDAELRYMLAMEDVSGGDDEAAVRGFRELIARSPDYPPGYLQAGQALTRLGREQEAKEVFAAGIVVARKVRDDHAAGEMEGFLDALN